MTRQCGTTTTMVFWRDRAKFPNFRTMVSLSILDVFLFFLPSWNCLDSMHPLHHWRQTPVPAFKSCEVISWKDKAKFLNHSKSINSWCISLFLTFCYNQFHVWSSIFLSETRWSVSFFWYSFYLFMLLQVLLFGPYFYLENVLPTVFH